MVIAWLRPRAKRLATCVGVVLFVLYAESEFMSYVQSLPDDDPIRGTIKWTLLLKNLVILVAVSVVIVPEVWGRVRPTSASESAGTNDSRTTEDAFSAPRTKLKIRSATNQTLDRISKPSPGSGKQSSPSASTMAGSRPVDSTGKQADRPIDEPASNDVDDGFAAIRRKEKLRGRIEQILDRKR